VARRDDGRLTVAVKPLVGKGRAVLPLATRRLNIWEGSVRSSKTVGSVLKWIEYVRSAPPGNLLMVGKTERTLQRNILDPIIEMLGPKRARLVSGSGEFFLCGRRIYLVGANDERSQDKIRGLTLLAAYVDEASLVPESFFTMLMSRLSEPDAKLFATTNPDGPSHWLKRDYLDRCSLWLTGDGQTHRYDGDDRLDLARFSFRLDDNPYLDPQYVASLKREYVGLWHKRFILGQWVVAEGAVYDMWDPDRHVVEALPVITRWLSLGVDYGTTNPFAGVLVGAGVDGRLYVPGEYRHDSRRALKQLTDVEYSKALRGWLDAFRHPGSDAVGVHPEWTVVDPSAASFIQQMWRDGITPAQANNDVLDGIRNVSSLLGAGLLKVHASCTALVDEFGGYSWDDEKAKKGEDVPIKVADHSLDALRYAIHTTESIWRPLLHRADFTFAA
jgi:PBSX family phage terminase large subunit